jgi:mRNA interferase RelE/StbE
MAEPIVLKRFVKNWGCDLTFRLEYSDEAVMQMEKLDKSVAKRILKRVESTVKDPHRFYKRLAGREEYKLRVGDYRVIADIDEKDKKIFIMTLGHRSSIYDKT